MRVQAGAFSHFDSGSSLPIAPDSSLRDFCLLRLLPTSAESRPSDAGQGHRDSAAVVRVVSRLLERVRVEQNHCQGLHTVTANCRRWMLEEKNCHWKKSQSPVLGVDPDPQGVGGKRSTYSSLRSDRSAAERPFGESPREVVGQSGEAGL